MTAFVLVGSRPPRGPEQSPALAAREAAALTTWHLALRRWGLLRSFAFPDQHNRREGVAPRLCLIVQVTGADAAQRLAARWESLGGYQVTVLALRDVVAAERRAS